MGKRKLRRYKFMMLQKKTKLGTLTTRYNQDDIYPGFWIDLRQADGELIPICNVEYEPSKNCIHVVVYKEASLDEPTDIIEINLGELK
jgi:hypothetical protein